MKKVLIAVPCLNGKLDVWFVNSLCESIKLGLKKKILFKPIFLSYESILPMARNELINFAYMNDFEDMVFIDDDQEWEKEALVEIIESDKDVITLPVVDKSDEKVSYNVYGISKIIDPKDGYAKVNSCGTGFLKLSKSIIRDLWESNPECFFRNRKLKYVFEYDLMNDTFFGEDIVLCKKIKELGYEIWVNPNYTVSHIGFKKYTGNFKNEHN